MPYNIWVERTEHELHLAGERVAAGLYREITTGQKVRLEAEGVLPATLNGRVGEYIAICDTWGQRQNIHRQTNDDRQSSPASKPSARHEDEQPAPPANLRLRLLVTSDYSIWADDARRALAKTEFEVVEETSPRHATLQSVMRTTADILLLDMGVIGGDGWDQLRALKKVCPHIAIVLMAGTVDDTFVKRAMAAGASGCLPLGTSYDDLLASLRQIACGGMVVILSS